MSEMTLKGFLDRYRQIRDNDASRRFCFILGAGASISSNIPAAASLAKTWLREMYDVSIDRESLSYKEWQDAGKHGIEGFKADNFGAMYFDIFEKRFHQDPEEGARYLEGLIELGKPFVGYIVLAYILCKTNNKLVITVNFDNLIADALFLHHRSHPIVCGHTSVAPLMPTTPHRPMVIKVHHDIFLNPLNDSKSMKELGENFKQKLPELLRAYTPIVVGYGGNDESLMKALTEMDRIPGGIYWCMRGKEEPTQAVQKLLDRHRGSVVRIPEFDSFMVQLGQQENFKFDLEQLLDNYRKDIQEFETNVGKFATGDQGRNEPVDEATLAALESVDIPDIAASSESTKVNDTDEAPEQVVRPKSWWSYQHRIDAENDLDKRDLLYREAIEALPNSTELLNNYGLFLHEVRHDYKRAKDLYLKCLEINPNYYYALGNYGLLLDQTRDDSDKAEEYYLRSYIANPKYINNLCNYALFLSKTRKDDNRAEEYFREAMAVDPNYGKCLGGYALLLQKLRKEYDRAEEYYLKAITIEPHEIIWTGNYATFLHTIRKNYKKAEEFYLKSLEIDSKYQFSLANYTGLLFGLGRSEAEAMAVRFEREAKNKTAVSNLEVAFYRYVNANLDDRRRKYLPEIRSLLEDGVRSPTWDFNLNIEQAKLQNHPEIDWIPNLAAVITEDAPLEVLDSWPAWQDAIRSK